MKAPSGGERRQWSWLQRKYPQPSPGSARQWCTDRGKRGGGLTWQRATLARSHESEEDKGPPTHQYAQTVRM